MSQKFQMDEVLARIESRASQSGECLVYTGTIGKAGYGMISAGGKQQYVHRIVCQAHHGDPPSGALALHSCDNRACCNPNHLRWGTHLDNSADAVARNRLRPGVSVGEAHGLSKLTAESVRDIRERRARGEVLRSIAARHGVTISTVSEVARRKVWRHLA